MNWVKRHSLLTIAVATVLVWTSFLLLTASVRHGGDLRAFLCLGEHFYHPPAFAEAPRTSQYGYDGQYYAALATDPLLRHMETAKALDSPFYRASRILIPLLAFIVAFGNAGAAITAYQLLCWSLAIAAVVIVAWWLGDRGSSPWWALLLIISGGLATTILRTTADGAALALILAGLALQARGKRWPALLLLCAATLTRETSWLAALAVAFVELREHRPRWAAGFLLAPIATFGLWALYLELVLPPHSHGVGVFGIPFLWLPSKLSMLFSGSFNRMEVAGLAAIVASVVALASFSWRPRLWTPVQASFVAFSILALFFNWEIYVEAYSYARVLLPIPFLAVIVAAGEQRAWRRWTLRAIPIAYALVGWTVLGGELGFDEASAAARRLLRGTAATTLDLSGSQGASSRESLYLVPVARAQGYEGASWQSEVRISNLTRSESSVTVELLLTDSDNSEAPSRIVTLSPGQTVEYDDAVGQLFSVSGAGALRVIPSYGAFAAQFRTRNVKSPEPPGPFLPAVSQRQGIGPDQEARLDGLVSDRTEEAWVRSNLGLLNVSGLSIRMEIDLVDSDGGLLGRLTHTLRPLDFHQFTDVLRPYAQNDRRTGSAVVRTRTPEGSFVTYAAIIRGQSRSVTYVFPAPTAAAAAAR